MANPIIINSRLKLKRTALDQANEELETLKQKRSELLAAVEDAENEEDLDAVQGQADDLDKQVDEAQAKADGLQTEANDLEKELEAANRAVKEKKEVRAQMVEVKNPEDKKVQAVRSMINYINSKGQTREGIVTGDVAAIIPKEILYDAQSEVKTTYDLTQYVNVRSVSVSGGTYNVAKKTDESLHTVEELAANPQLGKPQLITVPWSIDTYRGQITESHEVLRDAKDLNRLVADLISQVVQNTKNRLISDVLKTAAPKNVTTVDELKHLFNVDLDPAYTPAVITTQSGYQYLDTLKDEQGRYLLQPDITVASGYRLLGAPVQKVGDKMLGKQGDAVAFIGDGKRFDTLFDLEEIQIGWAQNENFAQSLMAAISVSNKAVDTAAGFFVTFSPKA